MSAERSGHVESYARAAQTSGLFAWGPLEPNIVGPTTLADYSGVVVVNEASNANGFGLRIVYWIFS